MRMIDIITKKRDGHSLTKQEINFVIENYVNNNIPDYQMSALLMAIYFQKLNEEETINLTTAMINSGKKIDLSPIHGIKVDKHSTGGVGDKTSLIVAPLVASLGIPVAKMSGRGLGHTGGTIDKLESFNGFSTEMTNEQFINSVNEIKLAIASQTTDLVLADKKLYSLRDVTGTVENISLIASSIMSKKISSGADVIVLDVKVGNGAFMKDFDNALDLAKQMVAIGTAFNKNTIAIITDMNQPLGNNIGNSLEVLEAIETLKGNGPEDLTELSLTISAYMVMLSGYTNNFNDAKSILKSKLYDKSALLKLKQMVENQNGNFDSLVKAKNIIEIKANKSGYIKNINAYDIGLIAMMIGAGRETKESKIDLSVGIVLKNKIGDYINKEDIIAEIHLNDLKDLEEVKQKTLNSFTIVNEVINPPKLIKALVAKDGIKIF